MKYACAVDSFNDVGRVVDFVSELPDKNELKNEYGELFQGYYSRSAHVDKLARLFEDCFIG